MSAGRERLLMVLLATALVLAGWFLLLRPSHKRLEQLHARIRAAEAVASPRQPFTPVSREERALLEDPGAPWRTRIPRIESDAARLAHVNRVLSAVSATLKDQGVGVAAMKATWDPVKVDFTVPANLQPAPVPWTPAGDAPELRLTAWVLEVEIPGSTAELFRALAAVPAMAPLLEPVGLRWGADPQGGGRQSLLLRNYYLAPQESRVVRGKA